MSGSSLADVMDELENPVEYFRSIDLEYDPYIFPDEYTNWIEEQRAVRETCALVDQSYHMETVEVTGPDAMDFLERLGVNNFESFRDDGPPNAINYLLCNPDGDVIGDVILFYLPGELFRAVGAGWVTNWILYNASISERDVDAVHLYDPFDERDPPEFRFQIQGPNALKVVEEVIDGSLPDIPFFQMDTLSIDGAEIYALSHGMAAMPGLELFGPYEHHDKVEAALLEAGQEHDLRQMGTKAYKTGKIGSGWFVMSVPAIYEHEELQGYREWLSADGTEARLSIGGSFVADSLEAYYMTPMERGQGHLVDFEHDFIGKSALEERFDENRRERVTLVWNHDDVIDLYASLFDSDLPYKFLDLPDTATTWSKTHYDVVRSGGTEIGVSKYPGYLVYEREMLSLASIDRDYSEPGTEVSFIWGERTDKKAVERHEPTEVRATVAPAPYVQGGRREM